MKKILLALAAAATLAAPAAASPRLHGEAQLTKILEGRTAGKPVDCIDLSRVYSSQIVDGTAIVYDSGNTLYVNRPRGGAESLGNWDVMVTKPFGHELCRPDVVQLLDSGSHFYKGSVFLGDFVPYTRDRSAR
ncbi:MAG TPA: hypothetical protein VH331_19255 [Allosphingosinicella sp.]|jgi:hypothetical protein|nr:hypothetical protein [Allosphingosinicella sp.]